MPQNLIPQVDVGSLTLRGLSAFTPLLAAVTADNVAPAAMIQLESLGALFHVNGGYATRLPELLQRCTSVPLDRIGMSIGWRKGDTSSIMAQSAGGQSVALLCFCLQNICKDTDVGSVLLDLSEILLSRSLSVSSIGQLTNIANLLAGKLRVLGFGNIMAKQVVRLQDACRQLHGQTLPPEIFGFLTREAIVELFQQLAKCFQVEDTLIRISGVHGMIHILALLLIMFPDNVMLTIDGLLVQEGPRVMVVLEIELSYNQTQPTSIQVEERLKKSIAHPLIIEVVPRKTGQMNVPYTFEWSGHVADALQLAFASMGLGCSATLVEACCDCLLQAVLLMRQQIRRREVGVLPSDTFRDLLGSEPGRRIYQVCSDVFRTPPSGIPENVSTAYTKLTAAFSDNLGGKIHCACDPGDNACNIALGWGAVYGKALFESGDRHGCHFRVLWRVIGNVLIRAQLCLLVNASKTATCKFDIHTTGAPHQPTVCGFIEAQLKAESRSPSAKYRVIHSWLMDFCNSQRGNKLACSDGSSTILPASLSLLKVDPHEGYYYSLHDGQLVVKGRSYMILNSVSAKPRTDATSSISSYKGQIQPSSAGEHSRVSFTIRESLDYLELRTDLFAGGYCVHVDLFKILCSAMGLSVSTACDHDSSTLLDDTMHSDVVTTSVAMPGAGFSKIAIVQTKDNATAQVLACEPGRKSMLQHRCCLNCAVQQAKFNKVNQIIVTS